MQDDGILTETNKKRATENLRSLLTSFVIPAAIVILLLKVIFSVFFIPSSSMEPTVRAGSLQFGWRLPYLLSDPVPERGEIVVVRSDGEEKLLCKRVIGIAGDEIRLHEGRVYRNGDVLTEPYLPDGTVTTGDSTYVVPEGSIFLLGDNRTDSLDARYWENPYVPTDRIVAGILFHGIAANTDN